MQLVPNWPALQFKLGLRLRSCLPERRLQLRSDSDVSHRRCLVLTDGIGGTLEMWDEPGQADLRWAGMCPGRSRRRFASRNQVNGSTTKINQREGNFRCVYL
jgi:hypothetical protein